LDGYGTEWEASGMNFAENLAGKKNAGKERSIIAVGGFETGLVSKELRWRVLRLMVRSEE
jgi:hypothetical protein